MSSDSAVRPARADAAAVDASDATARTTRPFEVRIVIGLVFGFGGLVFLAVLGVLALGIWSAHKNTVDLLRDKSEAVLQQLVGRIELYLRPAENQLLHLARQVESGRIDAQGDDLAKFLSGALAATPEVRSLVFIHADGMMLRALRTPDGADIARIDIRAMPVISSALGVARTKTGLFWGDVVRPETTDNALVNVRHPVHAGGRYLGLFAATVQVDQLSKILDESARALKGTAFVLYDDRFVLAHPRLIQGNPRRGDGPLPAIADIGDPVVEAFARTSAPGSYQEFIEGTGIRLLDVSGERYALLSRSENRFGDKPWRVGVYFPAADLTDELNRLRWAAIAGLAVLLASLLVAYWFARYLTAPLIRLATAAQRVRELALDQVERVPRGLFQELNTAAQAFNTMVVGLRWFETYVPKKLVRRLVGPNVLGDSGKALESKERTVTVMFTDIVGFTTLSETMPAPKVAALLNRHFALVTACIEAEGGTVDKFIGDSVMAFWGAPEKQKDHATRACRAALAIAETIKDDNFAARASGAPGLRIRLGLHTGPVVVGNIGAPGRINYTIVGDTVNTANRLEQLGKEVGETGSDAVVVLSAATLKAAKLALDATSIGAINVRGRQTQLEAFCYVA